MFQSNNNSNNSSNNNNDDANIVSSNNDSSRDLDLNNLTDPNDPDLEAILAEARKEADKLEQISNSEENVKITDNENKIDNLTEPEPNNRDVELELAQAQMLRAMADLQNFKKRAELEKQDFIKYASSTLLTKLLPVLDNFERAFNSLPEELKNHNWIQGVSQIEKSFVAILEKEGLEIIAPNHDDDFNTQFHECVMMDPNTLESKVGQCLEKGYQLKNKVLRVAKVSVGNKVE